MQIFVWLFSEIIHERRLKSEIFDPNLNSSLQEPRRPL